MRAASAFCAAVVIAVAGCGGAGGGSRSAAVASASTPGSGGGISLPGGGPGTGPGTGTGTGTTTPGTTFALVSSFKGDTVDVYDVATGLPVSNISSLGHPADLSLDAQHLI